MGYIKQHVYPTRSLNNRKAYRDRWWLLAEARPTLRDASRSVSRYIATPTVAKHRVFVWFDVSVIPDQQLIAIPRDDDYFFGVLHSKMQELWALAMGTWLGKGNDPRYTPTTTLETFPFPWPPGDEPTEDPRVQAIAEAARDLVAKRDQWLNPPGAVEAQDLASLRKRTLTNLYNQRPTWLDLAHQRLDRAVLDAYGWPHDLTNEEILERLLALNLERAGR